MMAAAAASGVINIPTALVAPPSITIHEHRQCIGSGPRFRIGPNLKGPYSETVSSLDIGHSGHSFVLADLEEFETTGA